MTEEEEDEPGLDDLALEIANRLKKELQEKGLNGAQIGVVFACMNCVHSVWFNETHEVKKEDEDEEEDLPVWG